MFNSLIAYALLAVTVISMGVLVKAQHGWISELESTNESLADQIEKMTEKMTEVTKLVEESAGKHAELSKNLQAANDEKLALSKKLARHDLEALAKAKPGLIERRINRNAQRLLDDAKQLNLNP